MGVQLEVRAWEFNAIGVTFHSSIRIQGTKSSLIPLRLLAVPWSENPNTEWQEMGMYSSVKCRRTNVLRLEVITKLWSLQTWMNFQTKNWKFERSEMIALQLSKLKNAWTKRVHECAGAKVRLIPTGKKLYYLSLPLKSSSAKFYIHFTQLTFFWLVTQSFHLETKDCVMGRDSCCNGNEWFSCQGREWKIYCCGLPLSSQPQIGNFRVAVCLPDYVKEMSLQLFFLFLPILSLLLVFFVS